MTPDAPRLLDRVRTACRVRHFSRRTEEAYAGWIRRFILFHRKRHPDQMGGGEVSMFLSWLAVDQHVGASTQNQALSAVLFLYREVLGRDLGSRPFIARARTPERLPVVLSRDEVSEVLRRSSGVLRLIVLLLYGAGLRLGECLELRVKDIDFDRHQIVVRRGKGQKDRTTMLPAAARRELAGHLEGVRALHQDDLSRGFGRVVVPSALDRKCPGASTEWRWQFVFSCGSAVPRPALRPAVPISLA